MFKLSSTLVRPSRSLQSLWRYLSAERLLDLLDSQELFFCHLPFLEDGLEGALTARTREHLASWFQAQNKSSKSQAYAEVEEYQRTQRFFYVNCWHMNDYESYLMWKAYGNRGFAIETNFERLQASFNDPSCVVTGGVVDYVNFERDLTSVGNVFNHVTTKDIPYRDEREFRLVFWDVDPCNANYPKQSNGVRIKVDIKMLVQNIVRSPYREPLSPRLEQVMEQNGFGLTASGVVVRRDSKRKAQ